MEKVELGQVINRVLYVENGIGLIWLEKKKKKGRRERWECAGSFIISTRHDNKRQRCGGYPHPVLLRSSIRLHHGTVLEPAAHSLAGTPRALFPGTALAHVWLALR